jgi:hypothetical protein
MFQASIRPDVPPTEGDEKAARPARLTRYWPEALAAATALLFAALVLGATPEPDVAWQLWIAHQLRAGARLYVDIVETNPPLWFWEAIPLDWAGSVLGIPSREVLVAAIGLLAALSVWTTGRLVPHIPARWRALLLVGAALTLLLMPLFMMGQREQLMLIAALPYAALAAARRDGRAVSVRMAAMIGFGVSFAFALKHYFLLTPALIELWLLVGRRRAYRPLRPETLMLAAMALLYAAAVLWISPEFLTRIVALNQVAYRGISAAHLSDMIRSIQYYWLIALAPLLIEMRVLRRSALASALALSALGFAGAWLIQFKGWPYQSIPTTGCLMLAVTVLAIEQRRAIRPATAVLIPAIVLLPLWVTAMQGPYYNHYDASVRPLRAGLGPREAIAFISPDVVYAWPSALDSQARYPSRYSFMWITVAAARDKGRTPALAGYAREAIENSAQDYRCAQPRRIVFDNKHLDGTDEVMEGLFVQNAKFADLMRHYHRIGRQDQFDLFERTAPFPAPPAAECRRGV